MNTSKTTSVNSNYLVEAPGLPESLLLMSHGLTQVSGEQGNASFPRDINRVLLVPNMDVLSREIVISDPNEKAIRLQETSETYLYYNESAGINSDIKNDIKSELKLYNIPTFINTEIKDQKDSKPQRF